ncbi:hypothetical protein PoB_007398300 [Plakobranchus ocellatus]|uniref:Uncharacterized protein n=1 Tax=Plakobranchus ocellatus TaxID=259542 RepID=A0AAV4DT53_9GAST|nr:hypothetical protein PoB_007398300 [Plakobranchus ocellatus]
MPSILIKSQLAKCYSFKNSLILKAPITIFYVAHNLSRQRFYAGYLSKECIHEICKLTNAAEKNCVCSSPSSPISPTRDIKSQRSTVRLRQYPPPGLSKASAPVRRCQYAPPGISKDCPLVRRCQYPSPGISKASAPACHSQHPQAGIWKASAPGHHRQYPPTGIPKASAPVHCRQYPPPEISKACAIKIL